MLGGDGDVPQSKLRKHPRVRYHPHDRSEEYPFVSSRAFSGEDKDLLEAESTFDFLNNTEAPTADGMSAGMEGE